MYKASSNQSIQHSLNDIEENIDRLQSAISSMLLSKSDVNRDVANQKLGSLRSQLKLRESEIVKYKEKLVRLPVHEDDIDSLVIEQLSLEQAITDLRIVGYTINDIPRLKLLVDGLSRSRNRAIILEDHTRVKDRLVIAIHKRKEFRGEMKAVTSGLSQSDLLGLIKQPVPVDPERSLPKDYTSRLRDLESKIKSISKPQGEKCDFIRLIDDKKYVPFDESQVQLIDSDQFIPIDINDEYATLDSNRSVYDEYDRLLADVEHNKAVLRADRENLCIEKHNSDVNSQIRWLQYQDITDEIDMLTKEDKDFELHTKRLDALEQLDKLQQLETLQSKSREVEGKISFIDYSTRINGLELEIADIKLQLAAYDAILEWYCIYDLLQKDLSTYTAMKTAYEDRDKLAKFQMYLHILTLSDRMDILAARIALWDKVTELESYQETRDAINTEVRAIEGRISDCEKRLTIVQKKINELDRDINDFSVLQVDVAKFGVEIVELELKCSVYSEYERLFNITGIPSVLLSRKLKLFSDTVNDIFQKYTKYSFECNLENTGGQKQKIDIIIHNRTDNTELEYTRLSGFESVLLNIALNKAILDIDTSYRPGVFIIDESLDCIDQDRFIRCLPTIFNVLKSHFNTILVISHRDIPRDIIDSKIAITNNGSYSMIE
jgi:hypothetical protein